jgi:hypothetical protein
MEILVYRNGSDNVEEGFTQDDLPKLLADKTNVVWVDLRGETPEQIEEAKHVLLNIFGFHHLTVEDCIAQDRTVPGLHLLHNARRKAGRNGTWEFRHQGTGRIPGA